MSLGTLACGCGVDLFVRAGMVDSIFSLKE